MKVFQLQAVDASALPVGGLEAQTLVLFDGGNYVSNSDYGPPDPPPIADRGTYTVGDDGTFTLFAEGASTFTGFVNDAVAIVNAGGNTYVYSRISVVA